jgi:hypothetical protein
MRLRIYIAASLSVKLLEQTSRMRLYACGRNPPEIKSLLIGNNLRFLMKKRLGTAITLSQTGRFADHPVHIGLTLRI